jgi:uncharacterized membrane protein YbaN (DUF454 family)
VGLLATGLAILGIWIPGLPTTPFVLLALWAFAQSSARLSAWLRRLPLLRSALVTAENYQRERALPLSIKIIAQAVAWGSTGIVLITTGSWWVTAAVACAAAACSIFMARTPTRRKLGPVESAGARPGACDSRGAPPCSACASSATRSDTGVRCPSRAR